MVEAATITGPVKALLMFSKVARRGLDGHGSIEHTLLTTVRRRREIGGADNEMLRAAASDGLEVDVAPERFVFDPGVLLHMARCIRTRAPDIVETHDFKSHFLLWLLRRAGVVTRPRWVAFHHGYTKMSLQVRLFQKLDRLSLRHADKVVTLCQPFVRQLGLLGVASDRIAVIRNAVAPKQRPTEAALALFRTALGLVSTDTVIVSVGRLSREKGHADLIRAFRALIEERPQENYRLVLVGDGSARAELVAAASDLGDRVLFVGHQPDPWPYFCMANLFVLPSHTEGSPLVLFEAMAAGLPIIATAVGGVPEVVQSGVDAILVPPKNISRLTRALAE